MMGGFNGGAGWGMLGAFGWGGMFLVWLAVIVLVAWALRTLLPSDRRDDGDAALAILRGRYAAGEITQAEYEQARRVLGAPTPVAPSEERREATSR